MLPEPFSTLAFLIVLPLLVQGIKLYRARAGKPLPRVVIQVVVLGVSGVFIYFSGGFVGLVIPAFPVWGGDLMLFLNPFMVFVTDAVTVFGLAYAAIVGLYETFWKWIFERVGAA